VDKVICRQRAGRSNQMGDSRWGNNSASVLGDAPHLIIGFAVIV